MSEVVVVPRTSSKQISRQVTFILYATDICLSYMLNQNSRTTTCTYVCCFRTTTILFLFSRLSFKSACANISPTRHSLYFIFLGTRHCKTFWPPGPLRPGGLSRPPSLFYLRLLLHKVCVCVLACIEDSFIYRRFF